MQVFVSTTSLADGKKATRVVEEYLRAGMVNIELGSNHNYEEDLITLLKNKKANYIVHNYFPPARDEIVLNLASLDAEILRKSKEQMKRSIKFCREIDAKLYSFHPGFLSDPEKRNPVAGVRNYDFNFSREKSASYDKAYLVFIENVHEIVSFAQEHGVKIACENAGSVGKNQFLLMSRPEEFEKIFTEIRNENFGLLLDLGHLNLAANANKFDKFMFVDKLKSRIMGIHIHDNNGIEDEHLSLSEDSWALAVIKRNEFADLPVVFEGRDLGIKEIIKNRDLIIKTLKGEMNDGK